MRVKTKQIAAAEEELVNRFRDLRDSALLLEAIKEDKGEWHEWEDVEKEIFKN